MSDFVGMNECSNCGALYPHHTSHTCPYRPAETFPRPPSNEQTLLTELGQCKAELAEARKDAKENWDGWEESMKGHGECLRLCEQLTAERDALAVTAAAVQRANAAHGIGRGEGTLRDRLRQGDATLSGIGTGAGAAECPLRRRGCVDRPDGEAG